jgi:hypothetical protein
MVVKDSLKQFVLGAKSFSFDAVGLDTGVSFTKGGMVSSLRAIGFNLGLSET